MVGLGRIKAVERGRAGSGIDSRRQATVFCHQTALLIRSTTGLQPRLAATTDIPDATPLQRCDHAARLPSSSEVSTTQFSMREHLHRTHDTNTPLSDARFPSSPAHHTNTPSSDATLLSSTQHFDNDFQRGVHGVPRLHTAHSTRDAWAGLASSLAVQDLQ